MDPGAVFAVLWLVNAVVYLAVVRLRREGSLRWAALLLLLVGPFCWVAWLSMRAGKRRSSQDSLR